jgi:GT2 family glycosyltransferase
MTGQIDLSIVIVNYNGGDLLLRCLASIEQHPPPGSYEVIVVENASTDGSGEKVAAGHPSVQLVRNSTNLGLSRAFNQGLRVARGRAVLSLDNDTRVQSGALATLLSALHASPEIGAVGARMLNPDLTPQKTARRFPSALNGIFGRRSLVTRWFPDNAISRRYLMDDSLDSSTPREVDWLSTAALMVPREVVTTVGGLDEGFFVYWVDADWCARIRRAGWKVLEIPSAQVIHDENLKRGRRSKRSARMVIDFHRGAYRYYRRNHATAPLSPMAAIAFAGLTIRAASLIAWDYLRGLRPA